MYENNDHFNALKLQYQNMYPKGKLLMIFNKCANSFPEWESCSDEEKRSILENHLNQLSSPDKVLRRSAVAYLAYIAMGNYGTIVSTPHHVEQIKKNTRFMWINGAFGPLYQLLIRQINEKVPENLSNFTEPADELAGYPHSLLGNLDQELMNTLTILYFILETNRHDPNFARDIDTLDPPILEFLIKSIGRLRWGVSGDLPLRHLFLFFWKALMCLFGDANQMEKTQRYMREKYNLPADANPDEVTASPLDYHAFRQDIISRYPAYVPPSSTLPETFENSRSMAHYIEIPRPVHAQTSNNALPAPTVHIATPAPSPPASPAIAAGQKVKKSVFMTNQSFPFIHPTEDDVPQSIIEASELFAVRVRTTPEMVQLWDERDRFMQRERGWVSGAKKTPTPSTNEKCLEEVILDRIEKLYVSTCRSASSLLTY